MVRQEIRLPSSRISPVLACLLICSVLLGTALLQTQVDSTCLRKCDQGIPNAWLSTTVNQTELDHEVVVVAENMDSYEASMTSSHTSSTETSRRKSNQQQNIKSVTDLSDYPSSLPPLIQILVGKLHLDEEEQRPKVIRSHLKKKNGDFRTGVLIRRRMRDYNQEWEEALRWISKWGQQDYYANDFGTTTTSTTTHSQRRNVHRSDQKKRGRKSHTKYRDVKKEENLQCLELCGRNHGLLSYPGDVETSFLQRVFHRYRRFLRLHFHTLRNLFGIVFSTSLVWLTKSGMEWWKLNQYSQSLKELLLLEESKVGFPKTITSASTSTKKTKRMKQNHHKSGLAGEKVKPRRNIVQQDEFEESDGDSVDRFYMLHNKNKLSPTKVSESKVASKSTPMEISIEIKQPKSSSTGILNSQKDPICKKTLQKNNSNIRLQNQNRIRDEIPVKALSREELEQSICKMALFQSCQLDRIINERLECDQVGRLSHLRLKDLHSYYNAPILNENMKIPSKQVSLKLTEHTKISSYIDTPIDEKEALEQNGVTLILSNILCDDDDGDDDDADKTWASSTSSSTKPESQRNSKETDRAIALGDLLVGSVGNHVHNSTKHFNPWNTQVEPISNKERNESVKSTATSPMLLWGNSNSERIW